MASNKLLEYGYSWGDSIINKQIAPKHFKPGCKGSICGIRTIDSTELAKNFEQNINSELYLVEFNDGETLEIPRFYLKILN